MALCYAPFLHKMIANDGFALVCCSYNWRNGKDYSDWNGEAFQELRRHMLEEKELPARCVECVTNKEPYKNTFDNLYKKLGEPQLDIVTGTAIDTPVSYDLRMNNLCNLSCRMCGPASSTQIAKEAIKYPEAWGDIPIEDKYNNFDPIEIIENAGAIYDLRLLGGEPTLQPESKDLLQELVDIGNTDIRLFITTNGTNVNKNFYGLVEKFKDCHIVISIDSWGEQHDYIRGPASDFATIHKNVQKIKDLPNKPKVSIQQTVTALNIFDFWKLPQNSEHDVVSNITTLPEFYAPKNLPEKWKKKAIDIAKENGMYNKCSHIFNLMMEPGDTSHMSELKHRTHLLDHIRGQHLKDHFPTTYEMLEDIE